MHKLIKRTELFQTIWSIARTLMLCSILIGMWCITDQSIDNIPYLSEGIFKVEIRYPSTLELLMKEM
jgi:hypothetical protein